MGSGAERHVRSHHHMILHINMGIIHHGQIEIHIDILAEMDKSAAPVGVHGRLDEAALSVFGKHLPQQRLPAVLLRGTQPVKLRQQLPIAHLQLDQLRIGAAVQAAVMHRLLNFGFIHEKFPLFCFFFSRFIVSYS